MLAGDQVLTASGQWRKVLSVAVLPGSAAVYNFEVADDHDYFVGDQGLLVHNAGPCNLQLKYMRGWTPQQIAAADAKVTALNDAETVLSDVNRAGTSAAGRYKSAGNIIPPGSDVDHTIDLQLGGSDTLSNMSPLDSSVNRSLGAQVYQQTKDLPIGTIIDEVTIGW